jgi:hypothetical protein
MCEVASASLATQNIQSHLILHTNKSQSYDLGIYNYNAGAVVGNIERFSKKKKIFLISKRARILVALELKSRRIGSRKILSRKFTDKI